MYLRRISGNSMLPTLRPDQIVFVRSAARTYRVGDIIIFTHDRLEKIKRLDQLRRRAGIEEIYVRGDNSSSSTDSRHFGWLPITVVKGKVIWPMRRKLVKKTTSSIRT